MFIRNEKSIKEFIQLYPVTGILVIINLSLWLLINFLQLPIGQSIYQWGVGSNFFIEHGQYWRLVTPIFLHGNLMHVLFNSFALVLFGPALEQMMGKWKFVAAYLGAGIAGNIATYLLGPASIMYTHLGASGSIYGLFGLYLYLIIYRKHLIDPGSKQIVLVFLLIGVMMTFLRPGINVHAHIFGLIGGFVLGTILLSNASPYSPWRNRPHFRHAEENDIGFDPNRWKKKRMDPTTKKRIIWGIVILLFLIAWWNRM
ncbi:rhomboid family intramembrane serine protease [Virgibacillus xinjiangensis]|uniref:Rhomboid family intramembrane serine protease n=1 Tax=Virgibacillus xinjiangensis TaxID=393090 RepID=A0ABV7CSG7_9BACI